MWQPVTVGQQPVGDTDAGQVQEVSEVQRQATSPRGSRPVASTITASAGGGVPSGDLNATNAAATRSGVDGGAHGSGSIGPDTVLLGLERLRVAEAHAPPGSAGIAGAHPRAATGASLA